MSYGTPPPPPPPPGGAFPATAPAPWYRRPAPVFFLILLIAAAAAIPILILTLGRDDEEAAAGTTTTDTAATTTEAGGTTQPPTTTQAPSTTGTTGSASTSTTSTSTTTTSTTTTTTTTTTQPALLLDYQLDAFFEQGLALPAGFTPDPYEHAAQSGALPAVNVSYLGGGCTGFAAQAPDFDIRLSGGSPLLCIWFTADISGADTTLIVNTQQNQWVCDDDSAGDRNPVVRIVNPVDGTYDIWIGSYSEGEYLSGTLHITETQAACP